MSINTPSRTAFISGPIQPWDTYFSEHYKPQLLRSLLSNHSFVMGPAPGIDTLSLEFLIKQGVPPSKITVYLAVFEGISLRPNLKWFEELDGKIKVVGTTTGERDAVMTADSDYDILRYMTIEEQKSYYGDAYFPRVSATERNERRRKGLPLYVNYTAADSGGGKSLGAEKKQSWVLRFRRILNCA